MHPFFFHPPTRPHRHCHSHTLWFKYSELSPFPALISSLSQTGIVIKGSMSSKGSMNGNCLDHIRKASKIPASRHPLSIISFPFKVVVEFYHPGGMKRLDEQKPKLLLCLLSSFHWLAA